jgi:hypothetical protein
MVTVKGQTKVKTGTVVKIGVDDKGAIRVTKGSTPWVDIDDEDDEDYDTSASSVTQGASAASASSATRVTQATQGSAIYNPTAIDYDGKRYVLKEPLQCTVKWDDDGGNYLWVEYPPFDLYNTGRTVDEAVQRFNEWFADTYEWLNDVHNDPQKHGAKGLGSRLEEVRVAMNNMVTAVININ